MAAGPHRVSGDARRLPSSNFNRYENRPSMTSSFMCRNGPQCRKYLEGTCNYNHDFGNLAPNGANVAKKSLNVDSPSFTPNFTPKLAAAQPAKTLGISPKAAAAATFTPRGSGTVTPAAAPTHSKEPSGEFFPQQTLQAAPNFTDFIPGQAFAPHQQLEQQSNLQTPLNVYNDPFAAQQTLQRGIAGLDGTQSSLNPYAQPGPSVGAQNYYQDSVGYKHPLNYHLYASIGPRRENMLPFQRSAADFFIPDGLREDLQKMSDAALQTFANSTLPHNVEHFHSLVALNTNNQKGASSFGLPSWVYKARSTRDGELYVLRRIEGFRLSSEAAIRTVHAWKKISSASVVQVHDAFTGRWFNDSSLIVVTDYHPLAQTLAEKYFGSPGRPSTRPTGQAVPESELWACIVQVASALKTIHDAGLAAQTIQLSKILVTAKNRLRLNGCAVLDVLRFEERRSTSELQRTDLEDLGRLVLSIATRNQLAYQSPDKAMQQVSRTYSERLRACLVWLLSPPHSSPEGLSPAEAATGGENYTIDTLLSNIADKLVAALDSNFHQSDDLTSNLMRELENGRVARLLAKLNVILERPDVNPGSSTAAASGPNQPSSAWSETGERYYLKLFRDYVFHQVDHEGRPVVDLGHIISCLNKLDAGIDEKIQLVSRDEQNVFVLSYRDVKRGFESAWAEINKAGHSAGRR